MIIGGDNLALEAPSDIPSNWIPVHTYLLAEKGIPIMEVVYLEELSHSKVYEFAFIGASLKIKGGTAGFMRPIAIPIE